MSLPNLSAFNPVTSTPSAVQPSTTVVQVVATTTGANGLPQIVTSMATQVQAAPTTQYATPFIAPPPAANNPYIFTPTSPNGTVFIAVGSVVGFILLCMLAWLLLAQWLAKRRATESFLDAARNDFYEFQGKLEKNSSSDDFDSYEDQRGSYPNPMDSPALRGQRSVDNMFSAVNSDRRSMFISPTAEVMNYHNKRKSMLGLNAMDQTMGHNPSVSVSSMEMPQPAMQSNQQVQTRSVHRKQVPSVLLDKMFEEDE